MYESYDSATVSIATTGNFVRNNLALGTIKEMINVSSQNLDIPGVGQAQVRAGQ